jgi:DNA-binding response OmpR family regulator
VRGAARVYCLGLEARNQMTSSVLVVEDDPSIRSGLMALLQMRGHSVATAGSVAEAASQLDADTPTHLVLDLNLPDGPGTEILQRIRIASLSVRVALVTGASDTSLMNEARTLGVDAVFIKPPDWDELLDWVSDA